MTAWARLTWQVADPATFAPGLAAQLGIEATDGGGAVGAWTVVLGFAVLEVRPWVRESATDEPTAGGRLMLDPVPGGEEPPGGDDAPLALAGIGWATVELDRAEAELAPWLGTPAPQATPTGGTRDPHLGARTRVRVGGGLPGESFVLLEPDTEGRLAASLARDGEGPCALYLRPAAGLVAWTAADRLRGLALSTLRPGPLGGSALLLGGPVTGPHLLLVDAPSDSNDDTGAGTIAP